MRNYSPLNIKIRSTDLIRFQHRKFQTFRFANCKNAETERVGCHCPHKNGKDDVQLKKRALNEIMF